MTQPIASTAGALFVVAALSACGGGPDTGTGGATFGDAVRHNIAVQTVNPDAAPGPGVETHDGRKIVRGVRRYQSDTVKPPKEVRTGGASVGTGGGGS